MAGSNDLIITAGLNIPQTTSNIKSELESDVAPKLNGILKITCNIDTSNTKNLQAQLNNVSKNVKIDANIGGIQPKIDKGFITQIEQALDLSFPRGKTNDIRREIKSLLTEYQKFYQMGQDSKAFDFMPKVIDYITNFTKEVKFADQGLLDLQQQVKEFVRSTKVTYDEKSYSDLFTMLGTNGAKSLIASTFGIKNYGGVSGGAYDIKGFIDTFNSQNFGLKLPDNDVIAALQTLSDFLHKDFSDSLNDAALREQSFNSQVERTVEVINNALGVTQRYNDEKALRNGEFVEIIGIEELDGAVNKATNSMNTLVETERTVVSNSALIKQAPQGFEDTSNVIKEAEQAFSSLGGVLKATATDITQPDGQITRFTINVTDTTNAVRAFTYALKETEDGLTAFELIGSRGNDSGIQRQLKADIKAADEYTSKLANLKRAVGDEFAPNIATYLGQGADKTIVTFETLQQKIEGLRNGTSSIEEVRSEFTALDSKIKELDTLLQTSQGKGFNRFANATITVKELDTTINSIQADIDKLSNTTKLNESLSVIQTLKNQLSNMPSGSDEWFNKYAEIGSSIRSIQNDIKLARKLENEQNNSANKERLEVIRKISQAYRQMSTDIKAYYSATTETGKTENLQSYEKARQTATALQEQLSTKYSLNEEEKKLVNSYIDEYNKQLLIAKAISQQKQALKDVTNSAKTEKLADDLNRLSQIIANLGDTNGKKSNLQSQVNTIGEQINNLSKIGDKTSGAGLIEWNKQLVAISANMRTLKQDIANAEKAEKQIEQTASKANATISQYIKSLSGFNNSNVAKNNATNTNVQSQTATNNDLIAQLQALQNSLKADISTANIAKVKAELDALIPSLDKATISSKSLDTELKNNNDLAAREARIKSLQNQIEIFAKVNATAVNSTKVMSNGTSFADEFERIKNLAYSGKLDDNAVKRLTEDFRNFKSETKAAGMTTNKFFTDMSSQLKMVISRWVSLYAVIGKIRTMINYVVQLDTAMINLKRVTNGTAEEYENFLETAAKAAQTTNTQLSDVVEQSARWAKAGFGLNELSKVSDASLIYSIVGVIDNETAVNDLVTALKGFRLEADETMSIVDKLDILNNKYATDAKSLGEGLSVSASAMAEAGNTLDQTLALLTGGSEITQNTKEMGNALKVVSMRIRGMKGELEALGEESEGIESISKVQTQILNLTSGKVNIFNDEGKFKSTFEILEDISKVIDKLSDPDRSSLSEILFGKMRGNQGMAILSAFQSGQITKALEDAQNSAGTAVEEMGRYSTSVTAHITNFKSAVQQLSNEMFDSSFLKFWVDFGKNAVTALSETGTWLGKGTKDIIGVKTALASLVAIVASFKGANYGKAITGLMKPSAISGISKEDVAALRNYNALIAQGVPTAEAQTQALNGASVSAQNLAKSANGAAVSERLLADAENKVTLASKAAAVAMNILWNVGITLAISAIVGAVSKLVDKLIVTKEEIEETVNTAAQSMQELADSNKQLADSGKEIDDLISQYTQLVSSTDDMSTVKTELQGIQDSLVDKFGEEAEAIDLLNGKYSDTIQKIKELSDAEYEEWKRSNTDKIKEAERYQEAYISPDLFVTNRENTKTYWYNGDFPAEIEALYEIKGLTKDLAEQANDVIGIFRTGSKEIMLSGSLQEAEKELEYLISLYSSREDFDANALKALQDRYNKIHTISQDSAQMLQEVESRNAQDLYNKSWERLGNEEKFNELIGKAVELNRAIQGDGTATQKLAASEELKEIESELYKIAGKSANYQSIIKNTFESFKKGSDVATVSVESLRTEWFETLDDMQKEGFKNIDKMKTALQSLANGENISSDDFWEISKLDTEGMLSDIKLINDEFTANQQSLIKLKDNYIKKIIAQIEADNQSLETEKKKLDLETAIGNVQSTIAKGVNSVGDVKLLENQKAIVEKIKGNMKAYGDEIERNNLLVKYLNQSLGNTVDLSEAMKNNIEKEVKGIESQIKDIENQIKSEQKNLKEQEKAIDNEIKALEKEKKAHEEIKAELEEQLEFLEEQQKQIEQIIDNYKTVSNVVKDYADSEIDKLKEQQEKVKNSYDEQITTLKEIHDQKEEENDLVEKQIDLQNKLKALEDARNNKKVRTYSSARGWHYEASKEEVTEAENAVNEAQKNLDNAVAEKEYNDRIKALETERDVAVATYESEIKAYEEYVKKWQEILEEETKAENERLANEILGYDWREKIKNKDTALLETFGKEFQNYNRQLDDLVNNEIATLKDSIKAKENEIDEIDKMIQKQNEYKSELQEASNAITDSLQEQIDALNNHKDALEYSLNQLENAWNNYANSVRSTANNMADSLWDMRVSTRDAVEDLARMRIEAGLEDYFGSDSSIARAIGHVWGIPGYSSGGSVTNTGIAMLHGKKNSAETVFNAAQSKELYNMVKSGNFANLVADKAIQGINSNLNSRDISNKTAFGDVIFNIEKIISDNPINFVKQLDGYMDGFMENYWQKELTKSYTQN